MLIKINPVTSNDIFKCIPLSLETKQFNMYCVCKVNRFRHVRLCDTMDCSPSGSFVHAILQVRIPEWVAMPSSRRSSQPRDGTQVTYVSCIGRHVLYCQRHLGSTSMCAAKSFQSCPTLCDPIEGSAPGSPVPGILQARTLEWVAISFSNA